MTINDIIEDIRARWPKMKPEAFDTYRTNLDGVDDEKLGHAWRATISKWVSLRAPTPAEIRARLPGQIVALKRPKSDQERAGDEKQLDEAWAHQILRTADGRRALSEGWGRELYLWARAHRGEYPTFEVLTGCIEATMAFRRRWRGVIDEAKSAPANQFGQIALMVAVNAGSAMENFEGQLRREHGVSIDPERALA